MEGDSAVHSENTVTHQPNSRRETYKRLTGKSYHRYHVEWSTTAYLAQWTGNEGPEDGSLVYRSEWETCNALNDLQSCRGPRQGWRSIPQLGSHLGFAFEFQTKDLLFSTHPPAKKIVASHKTLQ